MNLNISTIRNFFLDLIFPIKCFSCGQEGRFICPKCLGLIRLYNEHLCPICDATNQNGAVCGYCRPLSSLDGLTVILENSHLSRKLIHLVKYDFITDIFTCLQPKLLESLSRNKFWRDFYFLIPVPLHRRRFLERGFNQAQIICDLISEAKGNPIDNQIIRRIKYHHPQVGLRADKRKSNIVDSFKVNNRAVSDFNQTLILVDDVYTTGSTLEECAKELKLAGYKKVWGLVLIRG